MKKMYFLTVLLIIIIAVGFLVFSSDQDYYIQKQLLSLNIIIPKEPYSVEQIIVPKEFDDIFENYNLIQIESGFDLSTYRGKLLTKYTYEILNTENFDNAKVYTNILLYKNKIVGGDITCPRLNGFIKPLNYMIVVSSK